MKTFIERSIPAHRLIMYLIMGSLLPMVAAFWWARGAVAEAEDAYATMVSLGEQIQKKVSLQEDNRYILQKFCERDPLFLHRKLEPLPLLSEEVVKLQQRLQRGIGPEDALLEKRLQCITSNENKLSFLEGSTDVFAHHKETVESQARPVEVDDKDLESILNLLEDDDEDPSKPHCLIVELRLDRRKTALQETWSLFLKILHREYFL